MGPAYLLIGQKLLDHPVVVGPDAESYEADYKEDAVVAALGLFDQVIADAQTQLNLDSQAPKVLEVLQYLRYEALNAYGVSGYGIDQTCHGNLTGKMAAVAVEALQKLNPKEDEVV